MSEGSATVTTRGVGDYIATGLAISATISKPASSTQRKSTAGRDHSRVVNASNITAGTSSSRVASMNPNATGNSMPLADGNSTSQNLTWTGDCWNQWNKYWAASVLDAEQFHTTDTYIATSTLTRLEVSLSYPTGYVVTTVTDVYTSEGEGFDGLYPTTTYYVTLTPDTYSYSYETSVISVPTGTTTGLTTMTITQTESLQPTPNCILPNIASQCQSQWNSWMAGSFNLSKALFSSFDCPATKSASCASASISRDSIFNTWSLSQDSSGFVGGGGRPLCTQASLASSACHTVRDRWVTSFSISSSDWPATSILAPGCSLGCQSCAITGKSVQLFYWPSNTASATSSHASGYTAQAASNSSGVVVTAVTSGTAWH